MKAEEKKFPIAEIFTSPQGEGCWAGTMMTFIRLAGCTVGKPYPKERYLSGGYKLSEKVFDSEGTLLVDKSLLPIYTEECTLYDGRKFACDTDYRVKERLTIEEIMKLVPENIKHICISGGEPLMHNLDPFYFKVRSEIMVHIETSGTISLDTAFPQSKYLMDEEMWITVSPKFGCLPEMIKHADEIKLLVDKDFSPEKLPKEIFDHDTVFLQPVNYEHTVNPENVKIMMDWQKLFPQWRVGLQLHKVLENYIGEHVR